MNNARNLHEPYSTLCYLAIACRYVNGHDAWVLGSWVWQQVCLGWDFMRQCPVKTHPFCGRVEGWLYQRYDNNCDWGGCVLELLQAWIDALCSYKVGCVLGEAYFFACNGGKIEGCHADRKSVV